MLEIIIITVLGVWLVSKVLASVAQRAAPAAPGPTPAPAPKMRPVVTIEGTTPFKGDSGFVSQFGMKPAQVHDIKVMTGAAQFSSATPVLSGALRRFLAEGATRGPEIARYVAGLRSLAAEEAVYFVVNGREGQPPEVIAFIDKLR